MSSLLWKKGDVLSVNRRLAVIIGLNEAMVLQQMSYWLDEQEYGQEHEGRMWIYNTMEQWQAQFPFWSVDTVKRSIASLQKRGLIVVQKLAAKTRDQTNYYTIDHDAVALMEQAPMPRSIGAKCTIQKVAICTDLIDANCTAVNQTKTTAKTTAKTTITAPSAAQPGTGLVVSSKPKTPAQEMTPEETAHQAACRETWGAYRDAYTQRYGAAPVRNAKMSSQIKQLVIRIGQQDAPGVARFFVERVNDRFVLQSFHAVGLLLTNAEGYRTQWATNRTITATQAQQADKTAANFNAVDEAMAIMEQRDRQREAQHAGR